MLCKTYVSVIDIHLSMCVFTCMYKCISVLSTRLNGKKKFERFCCGLEVPLVFTQRSDKARCAF